MKWRPSAEIAGVKMQWHGYSMAGEKWRLKMAKLGNDGAR